MATIVKFLRDVRWKQVINDGGLDRELEYNFDKNDIIELTDDAFAADLIADGHAVADAGPVNTTEAEKGILIPREQEEDASGGANLPSDAAGVLQNDGSGNLSWVASVAGNTSVLTDNGDGTFTHDDGTGNAVTFDARLSTVVDNGNGTYTITDDSGNAVTITGNVAETVTSLSIAGNVLSYVDEDGVTTTIDLSLYLDDTNLARIVSGTVDVAGIATFTRDDASTFTLDLSSLLPVTAATAVSPAADDAAGAVGAGTDYARADHKHPAQGVSSDAGNDLSVGSDGLHFMQETVTDLSFNDATDELQYTDENGTVNNVDISGVVNLADAVSPAADDAVGAVGTGAQVAREDHKHPAQGVSADAGNALTVGSDGLHLLADMTGAASGTGGQAGAVPAPAAGDNIAFLRGDGSWIDLPEANLIFITDSSVAPAATGDPTDAEMLASLTGSQIGKVVWYNGSDAAGAGPETATHVWYRDMAGALVRLREPASVSASAEPLTSGRAELAASYTAVNTWSDSGLEVTLPAAGRYRVFAAIQCHLDANASNGGIYWRFFNVTDGIEVSGSGGRQWAGSGASSNDSASNFQEVELTVAAPTTIKLQTWYQGALTNARVRGANDSGASTFLAFQQLPTHTVVLDQSQIEVTGGNGTAGQALLSNADGTATFGSVGALVDQAGNPGFVPWGVHWNVNAASGPGASIPLAASSTASVGDRLEVYNSTAFDLVVAPDGGDTVIGSPADFTVPPNTKVEARVVAAGQIEIAGIGAAASSGGVSGYHARRRLGPGGTTDGTPLPSPASSSPATFMYYNGNPARINLINLSETHDSGDGFSLVDGNLGLLVPAGIWEVSFEASVFFNGSSAAGVYAQGAIVATQAASETTTDTVDFRIVDPGYHNGQNTAQYARVQLALQGIIDANVTPRLGILLAALSGGGSATLHSSSLVLKKIG